MESIFSWQFDSRFERGKQWYVIAATLVITAVIVSFLIGSYLFGIVMIVFTGVYLLYDVNTHPHVRVDVHSDGIELNGDVYAYSRMTSFVIVRVDNKPLILRIKLMSKTMPSIDLFLDPSIELGALRNYIGSYVKEDPETELTAMERLLLGLRL